MVKKSATGELLRFFQPSLKNWSNAASFPQRKGLSETEEKKRALTNLYSARPAWLELAHKKLNKAVFAAYGWLSDLSDDEILERLLALNLEMARKN